MTDKERKYQELGYEYAEGIESYSKVFLPSGRYVSKIVSNNEEFWEVQPPNDNYWVKFDNLYEALKFGMGLK